MNLHQYKFSNANTGAENYAASAISELDLRATITPLEGIGSIPHVESQRRLFLVC